MPPIDEIRDVLEAMGAETELMAIVGSYGDTLTDEEVLEALRAYNNTGSLFSDVTHVASDPRRAKLRIVRSDETDG